MPKPSRREFLASAMSLPIAAMLPRVNIASSAAAGLEMLIVGDSLIWGQGLEEKDKFYTIVKEWLERDAPGSPRSVNLKNKSHSGSTLRFNAADAEAHKAAGRQETYPYHGEVNVSFPSIVKQIDTAADEYAANGDKTADLVIMSAGITDITVRGILDPSGKDAKLREDIKRYCYDGVLALLEHTAAKHPSALIVVIGYYPMISPKTPASTLYKIWFETSGVPKFIRPLANNVLTRQLLRSVKKKALRRSRIWAEDSTLHLRAAVASLNEKLGAQRAVFVPSPITEEAAYAMPDTHLFRLVKKGRVEDPLYDERGRLCRTALDDLKRATGIDQSVRTCEIAAIGHPNPAGSRAYADAIKQVLAPVLRRETN